MPLPICPSSERGVHFTHGTRRQMSDVLTRIKRVRKSLRRTWKGQAYVVPNLESEECPDCGEHLFVHDAMHQIESHSPASAKRRIAEKKTVAGR